MAASPERPAAGRKAAPVKKAVATKKVAPEDAAAAKKAAGTKKAVPEKPAATVKKMAATKKTAPEKAPVKAQPVKPTAAEQDAEKKAASAAESQVFARAQKRARKLLSSPDDLGHLVDRANRQSRWGTAGPLAELATDLKALLRLIAAYARGDYRDVSLQSMILVVGTILYVLTPIDVIPDFIPGVGFLDDAAVVTFVLRRVRVEIEAFLRWEQARP